jgi:hypothetical protein
MFAEKYCALETRLKLVESNHFDLPKMNHSFNDEIVSVAFVVKIH